MEDNNNEKRGSNIKESRCNSCFQWVVQLLLILLLIILLLLFVLWVDKNHLDGEIVRSFRTDIRPTVPPEEKSVTVPLTEYDFTAYDDTVYDGIEEKDFNEKANEIIKEKNTADKGVLRRMASGFSAMFTWKDQSEADKAATDIKTIEDKLFLINFKSLKSKSNCKVFKGVHVQHYPAVIKNIAKMLNLPKTKEKALLQAVNVKEEFEENFDTFNVDERDAEQLFGKFAVKKMSPKWIAMSYTIKSVKFVLGAKKDQTNDTEIKDLISFNEDGNVTMTMKAEKYFAKYYLYESQVDFNRKCKHLLPEIEEQPIKKEF